MNLKTYIKKIDSPLAEFWLEFKVILYAIFAFLEIKADIVFILSILMIVDTFLGIVKSVYVSKLQFSFNRLLWGLVSKAGVLLVPIILALTAKGLGYDFKWLVEIVLKLLILSEGLSSITNILSIKDKKDIKNEDFISKILHTLRRVFKKAINRIINYIDV